MNNLIAEQETVDLSALDAMFPGTENIITPTFNEDPPPTNILADTNPEKALDVELPKSKTAKKEDITAEPIDNKIVADVLDSAVNELSGGTEPAAEVEKDKGRPKTDKSALVSYLAKKVEANEFGIPEDEPYDASKQKLAEYLATLPEDKLHNIIDSNVKAQIDEVRAQTPKEFFESLPEELQYAAAYVAEGGQDMKAIFRALSHVEEVKTLDPEKEGDQLAIARSYLQATRFGTDEQISEQIEEWKEADKLKSKANQFKPMLDDMQKQQVQAIIQREQAQRKQQQELASFYAENVYKTLESNQLAGIKLDRKFSTELQNGMLTTVAGPWSGKPVNYLGYGLEKAQYIEPDYEAVMLAAWALNDKKGFLEAMKVAGANDAVEKTTRLIKQNQGLGVTEQVTLRDQAKPVKRIPNTSNVLRRQIA